MPLCLFVCLSVHPHICLYIRLSGLSLSSCSSTCLSHPSTATPFFSLSLSLCEQQQADGEPLSQVTGHRDVYGPLRRKQPIKASRSRANIQEKPPLETSSLFLHQRPQRTSRRTRDEGATLMCRDEARLQSSQRGVAVEERGPGRRQMAASAEVRGECCWRCTFTAGLRLNT